MHAHKDHQHITDPKGSIEELVAAERGFLAKNYHPLGLVVTRALGTRLWRLDEAGNEITMIDALSCYGAVNYGHLNPQVVKAALRQIERPDKDVAHKLEAMKPGQALSAQDSAMSWGLDSVSRGIVNNQLGPFAEAICRVTGMDSMLPCSGGAEAVETAIKAARAWGYEFKGIKKDQAKILVANNNFHGRTSTIVSFSNSATARDKFGPYAQNAFGHVEFGNIESLKEALSDENICAFMVEPIQGEAGILIPPDGYLRAAQKLCREHNVLFILDEIQAGFGRSGKNFTFQHDLEEGSVPDGLILGKALGGGIYPVSAFLASDELMSVYSIDTHGSTFGGNPVASAIGLEVCNMLEDGQISQASHDRGEQLMRALRPMIGQGILSDVRGKGLWVGIDIDPALSKPSKFCEVMAFDHHVFCKYAHGQTIRLAPPLTCTENDIELIVKAIADTAAQIKG